MVAAVTTAAIWKAAVRMTAKSSCRIIVSWLRRHDDIMTTSESHGACPRDAARRTRAGLLMHIHTHEKSMGRQACGNGGAHGHGQRAVRDLKQVRPREK